MTHGYKPKSVTISRVAEGGFVSYKIEVDPTDTPKLHPVIGFYLGVKTLATPWTGQAFEGAKAYGKDEAKLALVTRLKSEK